MRVRADELPPATQDDVVAIRAVFRGTAHPGQQQRAMRYLLRFSRQIESYFKREDAASAVEALVSISTFFRFIGVVVLFMVGLYVLGLMASLVGLA